MAQPSSIGEYETVCYGLDGKKMFSNIDENSSTHIYYQSSFWLFSNAIGSSQAYIGANSEQICLEDTESLSTMWNVFNGEVSCHYYMNKFNTLTIYLTPISF